MESIQSRLVTRLQSWPSCSLALMFVFLFTDVFIVDVKWHDL